MKYYLKDVGEDLLRLGFRIAPIPKNVKFPKGYDNWGKLPQTKENIKKWLDKSGEDCGVCVVTDGVAAIDIDVLDPLLSRQMIQFVRNDILGARRTLIRRGLKPKALIPCRVDANMGKLTSSVWRHPEHGKAQIEILSNGGDSESVFQFVAYGDYPDMKGYEDHHYEWEDNRSLIDLASKDQLPTLEHAMVERIFKEFDDLAYQAGYRKVTSGSTKVTSGSNDDDDVFGNDGKRLGISDERVVELLNMLGEGYYDDYNHWMRIGCALKFQIEDQRKGLEIWKQWSSQAVDPKTGKPYKDVPFGKKWKTFDNDKSNAFTFAGVLYCLYSQENKNFKYTFDNVRKMFEECEDTSRFDELCIEVAHNRFNQAQMNVIETLITDAYKRVYGVKIGLPAVRRILLDSRSLGEMPDYLKKWVYLMDGDKFYDTEERISVTPLSFNSLIYRDMPDAASCKVLPSDMALKMHKIPIIRASLYMPSMASMFKLSEDSEYQYVNSYSTVGIPEMPKGEYTQEQRKAIERVEAHFEHLIADPKERDIFRQWVAYQVQYTGIPLGWAVFMHGVGGDGKSFFANLISAMIGDVNCKQISMNAIRSGFNKWASELSFGYIEEVNLQGKQGEYVYDSLKTVIASPKVSMIAKGKDEINVPNTANYIFFSNHVNALPIDNSDRRIMVIYSKWQNEGSLQQFKSCNPNYYPDLHDTYKFYAGALRRYFLEDVKISDEFLNYYDAPRTPSRYRLVRSNLPESILELLDIVDSNKDPFLCEVFLDVKYFRQRLIDERRWNDASIRWAKYLEPLGYTMIEQAVRLSPIGEYIHTVYSKYPKLWQNEDGVTDLARIKEYVNRHAEDDVFNEPSPEKPSMELDDL